MKKIRIILASLAVITGLVSVAAPAPVLAVNVFDQCATNADNAVCKSKGDTASSMIKNVINLLLYIIGVIAVIMIIVGGVRYTTSGGNASQLKEAKDTILYSVVGLVVAIMAFTIVNFVVGAFL